MVIMRAAALVATGTAGFLVGGAAGAAAGVLAWAVVLTAWLRLRARNAQVLPGPREQPQPSIYADFDDVIDRLDDIARERNWSLGKRYAIARMACENPTMTIDALEQRYERQFRPQEASEEPKNDASK
jgi:hypothetical protein